MVTGRVVSSFSSNKLGCAASFLLVFFLTVGKSLYLLVYGPVSHAHRTQPLRVSRATPVTYAPQSSKLGNEETQHWAPSEPMTIRLRGLKPPLSQPATYVFRAHV